MTIDDYVKKYPLITPQINKDELRVLLAELQKVLRGNVAGDVVEFGCYEGTTALFEARMLQHEAPHKRLWLYDSFEGLPAKTPEDESPAGKQFIKGSLTVSKNRLVSNFVRSRLSLPRIKKAWFDELTPDDVPPTICFAFLDGDYYYSIRTSLRLIKPRLSRGAVVVIDDYANEALPGAAKATDEFAQKHALRVRVQASLAILKF